MRSAHALARMIDRDAVASGSYFVVGSIVIGLKVISNNPLDNLPTKCPLQSSKAYKQVGSITLSEWLEMYYVLYTFVYRGHRPGHAVRDKSNKHLQLSIHIFMAIE